MAQPGVSKTSEIILKGEVTLDPEQITGCRFANRCFASKISKCDEVEPALIDTEDEHLVACYLYHEQSILDE
jgi:oligopeptide/dipeptide ABC transporter ATP-binding protein